ncbi:PLP-dependent aminotransferase family protein [Sporomusa sphaeroides]|uniref:aminotransferase-like domain-containing protein n=1 Tax=Sporomusa sphaeroides TaxID=47679 RepID=UPI002CBC0A39|nr:PLP-dependent aminotransferase family protein [Sporomusa sphaeroides]HML33205.1 PLP-dependent aminotransferase family protein [Sporomusa sphaeroides]
MAITFARRMKEMEVSIIREILKITQRPEVISFAGGLPAHELFPVDDLKNIRIDILENLGNKALQYSTTEGYAPLREQIAYRMKCKFNTNVSADNILITHGSQQAIDFAGRLFLDEDDIMLCESPTYLAAISAFRAYRPKIISVPTDNDGMIMSELEKLLKNYPNAKLMYVIPDFQNPTGRTWSVERRQDLVRLANKYEIPIVEDNPYGELRFEGMIPPSIKSFDTKGLVISIGTFSKTFCPGMRIGWLAAESELFNGFVRIKQSADLHTSTISQIEISKFIENYDFDLHIKNVTELYKIRRDSMMNAMKTYFPNCAKFSYPAGGLFTWVELPPKLNTTELLMKCLDNNVAFVPGAPFFPDIKVENTLRLSYSNMPDESICEGIRRIADTIKECI